MQQPIAYVDSDKSSLSFFSEYLSDYFPVIPFCNPLDCLEAFREHPIPYILSKFDNIPLNGLQLFYHVHRLAPDSSKILLVKENVHFSTTPYPLLRINFDDFKKRGPLILKNIFDTQLCSDKESRSLDRSLIEDSHPIIGSDPVLMETMRMARKIASLNETVLIGGETGTGKDLLARFIHESGQRRKGPLHFVNCAAINPTLFESEFFGHRKGSFTGAVENMEGHFKAADHGTLVLDEVSEIDMTFQVKLLRAIENHEIIPVGTQKQVLVDTRIIAITNKDIKTLVERGLFREDLYHRLNIFSFNVGALRDRIEDLEVLFHYFLKRFMSKYGLSRDIKIENGVVSLLKTLPYEGNVRELENLIYRVMGMKNSHNGDLKVSDFLPFVNGAITSNEYDNKTETLKSFLSKMEKKKIQDILSKYSNNISQTAENLGISRQNLQYRMKKLKIGTHLL